MRRKRKRMPAKDQPYDGVAIDRRRNRLTELRVDEPRFRSRPQIEKQKAVLETRPEIGYGSSRDQRQLARAEAVQNAGFTRRISQRLSPLCRHEYEPQRVEIRQFPARAVAFPIIRIPLQHDLLARLVLPQTERT